MQKKYDWKNIESQGYPILRGRRNADAVIIGGGLSGLSIALWLCKAGLRVTLLEGNTIGSGSTASCGGFVSLATSMFYHTLEQKMGQSVTAAYAQTQISALGALREIAGEAQKALHWRDTNAWLVAKNARDAQLLSLESDAMKRAGLPCTLSKEMQCPFPGEDGLLIRDMATLDAAGYVKYLTKQSEQLGLRIFEKSRVTSVDTNMVYTQHGSVLAPYVIVATGYPVVNTPGWYFLRLMQRRSAMLQLETNAPFDGMFFDANGDYALRRSYGGMALQMNLDRVGRSPNMIVEKEFEMTYASYLDGVSIDSTISGIDTYSADGLPYIGAYSKKTPNLFVAAGYGGRGLIGSMVAAQSISAKILGLQAEGYSIYEGQREGKKLSRDEVGASLSIAGHYLQGVTNSKAPRCTHMGCKLVYRPMTCMWECPCHGSRFDDIGHVISAPATQDAQIHGSKRM